MGLSCETYCSDRIRSWILPTAQRPAVIAESECWPRDPARLPLTIDDLENTRKAIRPQPLERALGFEVRGAPRLHNGVAVLRLYGRRRPDGRAQIRRPSRCPVVGQLPLRHPGIDLPAPMSGNAHSPGKSTSRLRARRERSAALPDRHGPIEQPVQRLRGRHSLKPPPVDEDRGHDGDLQLSRPAQRLLVRLGVATGLQRRAKIVGV